MNNDFDVNFKENSNVNINATGMDDNLDSSSSSRCDPKQNHLMQGNLLNMLNNYEGVRIASLNINSITKHIDELRLLMECKSINILAINESKIDETVLDCEVSIAGYKPTT